MMKPLVADQLIRKFSPPGFELVNLKLIQVNRKHNTRIAEAMIMVRFFCKVLIKISPFEF